jgi:hypothetical protein
MGIGRPGGRDPSLQRDASRLGHLEPGALDEVGEVRVEEGTIGGKLYVAGTGGQTEVDIYDPATDTWSSGTPLGRPRRLVGGDAVKAKLYLVGGETEDATPSRATNQYDPATNSWTARAQVPEAFDITSVNYVRGTRIMVGGQPRLAILGSYGHHWQYAP